MTPQEILTSTLPDSIKAKMAAIQTRRIETGCIASDGSSHATAIDADYRSAILEWHDRKDAA